MAPSFSVVVAACLLAVWAVVSLPFIVRTVRASRRDARRRAELWRQTRTAERRLRLRHDVERNLGVVRKP